MPELTVIKNELLPALLAVSGAVDRRQRLPVLSNLLFNFMDTKLSVTATDLEIEITASINCNASVVTGATTIPAKKFIDIIRSLEENIVNIILNDNNVMIKSGRSQFKLATLPVSQFPIEDYTASEVTLHVNRANLWQLLQSTHFAISQQEVRFFLNSLLFEIDGRNITTVAIDGHRMAVCSLETEDTHPIQQFLLPRRGVLEMLRLLSNVQDETLQIMASKRYFRVVSKQYSFITKLTEARFPSYKKAITLDHDKFVQIDRDTLKRSLTRIAILANEKSKAVLMHIQPNGLTLIAHNQEQEEAKESVEAVIEGHEIKIGVNATYLCDVLHYLPDGLVRLSMTNPDKNILVQSINNPNYQYIIMPMKI